MDLDNKLKEKLEEMAEEISRNMHTDISDVYSAIEQFARTKYIVKSKEETNKIGGFC